MRVKCALPWFAGSYFLSSLITQADSYTLDSDESIWASPCS